MLTIARTLTGNPTLLLLDKASEGIASELVKRMAKVIAGLGANAELRENYLAVQIENI